MSLDLSLNLEVGSINITHNMGNVASMVPVGTRFIWDSETKDMVEQEITLYEAMWRPEEVCIYTGADLVNHLKVGLLYMLEHEDELARHNPTNGWGNINGLINVTREMAQCCAMFPEARLESDR